MDISVIRYLTNTASSRIQIIAISKEKMEHVIVTTLFTRGTRYSQFIQKSVWTGTMPSVKTTFHIFEGGTVMSQIYCTDVFLDHNGLYHGAVVPDLLDGNNRR